MTHHPDADDAPAQEKANILLVDDQPANLLALRTILDDLDQNLLEARSGEEARRRLPSDEFAGLSGEARKGCPEGFSEVGG